MSVIIYKGREAQSIIGYSLLVACVIIVILAFGRLQGSFYNTVNEALNVIPVLISDPVCGDVNGDYQIDVDDIVFLTNYIDSGGPPPRYIELADTNGDGTVSREDVIVLVNYVIHDGPKPEC